MTDGVSKYLSTHFQQYIAISKYARWLPEENRRETWEETVDRYIEFMVDHVKAMEEKDV